MTSSEIQIVADYEQNGSSPRLIAESMDMDIQAIKATLFQFSPKFREESKQIAKIEAEIPAEEIDEFTSILKHLARCGESDSIRLKACTRLIDEGKGRLNKRYKVEKIKRDININVINLNNAIQAARQKAAEACIDVEEVKQLVNDNTGK